MKEETCRYKWGLFSYFIFCLTGGAQRIGEAMWNFVIYLIFFYILHYIVGFCVSIESRLWGSKCLVCVYILKEMKKTDNYYC